LAQRHISLLTKGPKFTPISTPKNTFYNDIKDFTRKVKIREVFSDKENDDISIHRNKSNKQILSNNPEINSICNFMELLEPTKHLVKDNLTQEERNALQEITNREDIIIKRADKGGNFVIMDKDFYREKLVLQGHLNGNEYQEVTLDQDNIVMRNLKILVNKYQDVLTTKELQFITNFEWKSSNFYVLPKIHKCKDIINTISTCKAEYIEMLPPENLKGRPIVAGPVSPTQRLSEFLDTLLKPIVPTLSTYVKDDWDFLRKLPKEFDTFSKLYSYDVVSLYTSIPHELGLTAVDYWIDARSDLIPERFSKSFILEAVKFVLENNNFLFDNKMFRQISGTAMGTKFAPPLACLTMGYLEETILFPCTLKKYFNNQHCEYIRHNYLRYMDDGFIVLPEHIDSELFKNALNELHPAIKFTMEEGQLISKHEESLHFLDIEIILTNGKETHTDIYYKDTNPHDYLNFHSAHPTHIKNTIPFNLAKRIIVFTTKEDRIKFRLKELKDWLLKCNYPNDLIEQAFHKAKLQGPAPNPDEKSIIPLVTTYYPSLNYDHIMKTITNLFGTINDPDTKRKFKETKPVLALKQPPNLNSILTKAMFTSTANFRKLEIQNPGIVLCNNNRCKLCKLYLQPVTSFTTATGNTWNIKSHITCDSKNVVYFLSCNLCNGDMNYIGQTTNLRQRMNNHISESRNGVSTCNFPKHVFNCGKTHKNLKEPYFKVYTFMKLSDSGLLINYESKLFEQGRALMN